MKTVKSVLILASLTTFLFSCKKDDDNTPGPETGIQGSYDFIDMEANTFVSQATKDGDDTDSLVSTSNYRTTENKGTVTIDGTRFNTIGFSYKIATTIYGAYYLNGEFFDEMSSPIEQTIPASNGTSSYKLIGTDSIYFDKGFVSSPVLGENVPAIPSGSKFKWAGDTLILTSNFRLKDTTTIDGFTYYADRQAKQVTRLKKK
jgi:hypothetical protein